MSFLSTGTSSKKRLILMMGFLAAFIVVLNAATFALYRRARTHLDNELGERLRTVASTLGHTVEIAVGDTLSARRLGADVLTTLHLVGSENQLSNIVVLTPDGITIFDLQELSSPGEPNPFIELDFSAVTLARSGLPAYTSLYRSGDVYMKSAYAPVSARDGTVIGIIGVEAGAGFFDELRELTKTIVTISLAGILLALVLAVVFYRQSRSLDRAQEAVVHKENLATMGRMVANIAHEIRNPLSIIKTSAERLRRKYRDEDEVFSYISEEVEDLNRILTGYLSFAGSHGERFMEHAAAPLLDKCVRAVEEEVTRKQVHLTRRYGDETASVYGDAKRVQQAVLNVMLNAVEAVREHGNVDVSIQRNGNRTIVTIRDDGPGIDPKDLGEITKPFVTRKVDGSGLGLSIVESIMKQHHGDLEIDSAPGAGTTVKLLFPSAQSERRGT